MVVPSFYLCRLMCYSETGSNFDSRRWCRSSLSCPPQRRSRLQTVIHTSPQVNIFTIKTSQEGAKEQMTGNNWHITCTSFVPLLFSSCLKYLLYQWLPGLGRREPLLTWHLHLSSLTTFGFILSAGAVGSKIAHLVWLGAGLPRRLREIRNEAVVHCTQGVVIHSLSRKLYHCIL